MKTIITPVFFVLAFSFSAHAADVDAASASALTDTQNLLQDPIQRKKVIDNNPTAQTVDAQVSSLAGNPQTANELYTISGKVLEDLVTETGGDPVKMLEIMSKAQADPKSLMNHLSDQNKTAIHSVSTQIDSAPTTVNRQPANAN